jgi:inner membrane protein
VWQAPETYLWPLYGWVFPTGESGDWLSLWISKLTDPQVLIPEIIGLLVLVVFAFELLQQLKLNKGSSH